MCLIFYQYVDFKQGDTSGFVRFEDPESVKKARMAAVLAEAGGIVVKDHIVTLEAVEGVF
jgi:lupus La protein